MRRRDSVSIVADELYLALVDKDGNLVWDKERVMEILDTLFSNSGVPRDANSN